MIRSMTAYAAGERATEWGVLSGELRAVNHRFLELGLRLPEDVSVVGFDDVPPAAWPAYNLTTYRQHADQMVASTVDLLMTAIQTGEAVATQVVLPGALTIRGSTRRHGGRA